MRQLIVLCFFLTGCCQTPTYHDRSKAHHDDDGSGRFVNTSKHYVPMSNGSFLKWRWQRLFKDMPLFNGPPMVTEPRPRVSFLRQNRERPTATWIGHASVLVQMGGLNIVTDPHFTPRASPISFAGPRRHYPANPTLNELPAIDAIVISHDHYDSLDLTTVRLLRERPEFASLQVFVPLGLKAWFLKEGYAENQVHQLDWWESKEIKGVTFTALPTQHWSKRTLFGRNETLWAGWSIQSTHRKFYFVGDSGYDAELFKNIGKRYGPFDLSAIPIGAYEPRWFMRLHHVNPAEAVKIHGDVGSKRSMAIHWGTFKLTDEALDQPPQDLAKALEDQAVDAREFLVLKHGETIEW